ncbi:MAG: peptidase S9 prolyl oligopeptidase active site domain-containing protein [Chitinophagaceae bacterium]|nr:MAG: peptidase S9 prolyl oligopeptidase active site domain-containing protein [Chitinophagaceae bacterium]
MRIITSFTLLLLATVAFAQKKPLDHSVYDGWQNIVERTISNDGKYIAFTVNPQEGDGTLMVKTADGATKAIIARGYGMSIADNSQFLVCRIKPLFSETRDARIKKKRPDEMPKDSLAIVELSTGKITKIARIKSFKIPDESGIYVAYLLEKSLPETPKPRVELDSAARLNAMVMMADSLLRVADSIRNKASEAKINGLAVLQSARNLRGTLPRATEEPFEEGTELVVKNLVTGESKTYKLVSEYFFNKKGTVLLIETTKKTGDNKVKPSVVKINLASGNAATVFVGFNDAKGYRMDEEGKQLAFVAERDSSAKSLQKFYQLYYHSDGSDSAKLIANRNTNGVPAGSTIGEFSNISFSKTGKRLFFGTSPILPVKDTLTPDFERVSVDIWGQKDDYIQPVQLRNLENELRRSHLARYDFNTQSAVQLSTAAYARGVQPTMEGDGKYFYGVADEGKRIATQWQGYSLNDLYVIDPETGSKKLILNNFKGNAMPSYTGKYLLMYDEVKRGYSAYDASLQKVVSIGKDINTALYDEENDVPDDPNAYGVMGWTENDEAVLVYDMYDIWKVDPTGVAPSVCLTGGLGRKQKLTFRNIVLDREERFIKNGQHLLLSVFNNINKGSGLKAYNLGETFSLNGSITYPTRVANAIKAKDATVYSFSTETYQQSPNIKVSAVLDSSSIVAGNNLYQPNQQQANYTWGSAELFKWKAYTGKETEGVLYKPENFDPTKKYPMIVYFYERNANTLYSYNAPAPTPSRLNIPFFVSRGYIVFVPDIWYKTGYPGQGGYDHIVSGTRALIKKGFVDSTKIGLQGQSWGGFQIVYLITKTNLYAAAWAGAPVANMTSAYGGIRWGTGLNRQFQYEKTQSRIGANLWEKPQLYIENSALFSLPKVKTPLVIMANDADDAVPWYQGIEMYTGMRRLGKQVWMLNYNNEAHNLVERKNRKDIQIREQQFFDYLLKGDKPAKWITEGVPAIMKGRDRGLGY